MPFLHENKNIGIVRQISQHTRNVDDKLGFYITATQDLTIPQRYADKNNTTMASTTSFTSADSLRKVFGILRGVLKLLTS